MKHLAQPCSGTKSTKVSRRNGAEHIEEEDNQSRIAQTHLHDERAHHAGDDAGTC